MVWTEKEVHIERIYPDDVFWIERIKKVHHFFNVGILPELLGNFFSRPAPIKEPIQASVTSLQCSSTEETDQHKCYCYCQEEKGGDMIGCDNQACQFGWFHFQCLQLSSKPQSRLWYCPDCRKLPDFRRKRSKQTKNSLSVTSTCT